PPELADADGRLRLINRQLDDGQRRAVEFALRQRRLAVIHGPPGTGKTTVLIETILQHRKLGHRVLVCAQSNAAVDNLLAALHKTGKRDMVRVGHPGRIPEGLHSYLLQGRIPKFLKKRQRQNISRLEIMERILLSNGIVLSTLTMANEDGPLGRYGNSSFDLVVIDECSQALEAACWLAAARADKLVLAGDHFQLPATIKSRVAARQGLGLSLMERQVALHGDAAVRMLCTQYRMHELIQRWPSETIYDGRLVAAQGVRAHRLPQLPGVKDTLDTSPTLLLVDTAGCKMAETSRDRSKVNEHEADIVARHAHALVLAGLPADQVAIITPYKQQVSLIRNALHSRQLDGHGQVEVGTVDGFQGREKEAVLLSLVRSNQRNDVGFLKDRRRTNVAVTRARRQLFVVCDTNTVCADEFIRSLIAHLKQCGEVRSARGLSSPPVSTAAERRPTETTSTERRGGDAKSVDSISSRISALNINSSTLAPFSQDPWAAAEPCSRPTRGSPEPLDVYVSSTVSTVASRTSLLSREQTPRRAQQRYPRAQTPHDVDVGYADHAATTDNEASDLCCCCLIQ
ncbi:DNA-binding protein SMUBP-2-like, partial [Pollicipes pollicipes]|uniref:DNA-binding protein SMUBP-2-like n=1 Tax=Pollicipes pollicipes TaxID=41117 RepID=UPI001884B5C3